MPKVYVRIDSDGIVREVVHPYVDPESGKEYTVVEQFGEDFAALLTDVTGLDPTPDQFWTYDGTSFHPPYVPPVDYSVGNKTNLNGYLSLGVCDALSALFAASDFGDSADPKMLKLKEWQDYYNDLNKVDLTLENPVWPTAPAE